VDDFERREILYASHYEVNGIPIPIEGPIPSAEYSQVFDTRSNHLFESWTDADLYRAIDAPENGEPGERQDEEIAEYVEELKKRKAAREALAARSAELREKYQI
jgi:hypothetical protein